MDNLKAYYLIFGEFPILPKTMSYEDEVMQDLISQAIINNEKITPADIDDYIKKNNIVFDIDV